MNKFIIYLFINFVDEQVIITTMEKFNDLKSSSFENNHFFHTMLGLDICPYEVPLHIPEYCHNSWTPL